MNNALLSTESIHICGFVTFPYLKFSSLSIKCKMRYENPINWFPTVSQMPRTSRNNFPMTSLFDRWGNKII